MLATVGVAAVADLFSDIPAGVRNPRINLPPALSEMELKRELAARAAQNSNAETTLSFLGAGSYRHFVPAVVRALVSRGEFATAYTPYQPEVSQGTLQATYEFQSMVCQLTGMEVANSGMYDGATALAEAALMAARITGRDGVAVLSSVSPIYRDVLQTYASGPELAVTTVEPRSLSVPEGTACLIVQQPNFFGYMEDLGRCAEAARAAGALLAVSADPMSLGLFRQPGDYGADIVVGEGQAFGNAVSFGGPYVGLFASRDRYLRQMPGRIAGRTLDARGRPGFTLTLQTREQHIRRERATSNICTSEQLVALASTIYLAALGRTGLRHVAELCYQKAHYAASRIAALSGWRLPFEGVFFQEFVAVGPRPTVEINAGLRELGIIGGLDINDQVPNGMLLCFSELHTKGDIDRLVDALGSLGGK
jgi:glycine dehydrogenase subunit 1